MNKKDLLNNLWALWSIQESLLQNYRTIFISSESILFSLAVTVLSIGNPYFSFMLVMPGLFLHSLWRNICSARARDVTFVQRIIEKTEQDELDSFEVLSEFKRYQNEFNSRTGYSLQDWNLNEDEKFKKMLLSKTRKKMDSYLPKVFAVLWILIVIFIIVKIVLFKV